MKEKVSTPPTTNEEITPQDLRELFLSIEDDALREQLKRRLYLKRLEGAGRPCKSDLHGRKGDGYGRTTLIINLAKWEKIKEISLRETMLLKDIMEQAMDIVIERYEAKHGEVKVQPKNDIKENFNQQEER